MFPLSFPLLRRCQKKCESVQKFLQKCLNLGFVVLQNTDLQKEKKGHCGVLQTDFFCDLASDLKKTCHRAADLILSAICGGQTKNKRRN